MRPRPGGGSASAPSPSSDGRGSQPARLVLVAEDSTQFRYGLRRAVEGAGYSVLEASTGEEALDVITDERVDVLILDLVMPGLNGIELLQELRKRSVRSLHIVAMSGVIRIDDALEARLKSLGVACVLQKPFEMEQLIHSIA
jgi:CheY-like chemotaxis protein